MHERPSAWPTDELATVLVEDLPVELRAQVPEIVVPTYMFGFEHQPTATTVHAPDERRLVAFARGLATVLCIDPDTGHVVDMVVDPGDGSVLRGPELVSSSLAHFRATVLEAIRRFPFHTDDADMDDTQAAADDLREHLSPIDPPAWLVDGYWDTFYWNVSMGDYAPRWFDNPGPRPDDQG